MPRKRSFGNLRTLPSGRVQARYTAPDGTAVKAPHTFASRREADGWLAVQHADLLRGTWRDPAAGAVTLGAYAHDWLANRAGLAPRTVDLYRRLLQRWVLGAEPTSSSSTSRGCRIGDRQLRQITPATVSQWFAWVLAASHDSAVNRQRAAGRDAARHAHALRHWARERGIDVAATGKLPRRVHDAWHAAGSPRLVPDGPDAPRLVAPRPRRPTGCCTPSWSPRPGTA